MCQSNSKDKPHLNWLFFFLEWTKMIFWFNTLLAFSYIWYLAILSTCFQHFPKITFGLLISERTQERWLDTYCAFDQVHLITSKKIETTKVKPPGGARHNLALHASLYIQVYLWVYKWYPDGDIAITALYDFWGTREVKSFPWFLFLVLLLAKRFHVWQLDENCMRFSQYVFWAQLAC